MLVRHNIIFIFGIQRLVVRWHVDFFWGKVGSVEFFEKVGNTWGRKMEVSAGGVAGLGEQ